MKITVNDLSVISGTKITISFEIILEEKTTKNILAIFSQFSRFNSSYIRGDEFRLSIKEHNDNILISYGSFDRGIEKEYEQKKERFISDLQSVSRDIIFNETDLDFDISNEAYFKIIKELVNYKKDLPFTDETAVEWFRENISRSHLPVDVLVGGETYYSYYPNGEKIKFCFNHTGYNRCATILDEAILDTNDVISAFKNIVKKLDIKGYPMSMFDDRFISIMIADEPELFDILFEKNIHDIQAISFYNMNLSDKLRKHIEKVLKRKSAMKRLDNPLHKKKEGELKLFKYRIEGEATKSDGYSCWDSDIDELFFSDKELDKTKLLKVYEEEVYHSELKEFRYLNIKEDNQAMINDRDTFIEVDSGNKYITRPANYRFKAII